MKKWEEERKKKQYAQKISGAKATLKTQPKGAKVPPRVGAGTLSQSGWTGQGISRQSQQDYHEQMSMHPSRGQAEFGSDNEPFLAMGSPGIDLPAGGRHPQFLSDHLLHGDFQSQNIEQSAPHLMPQMVGGLDTGTFSNIEMLSKQVITPSVNLENNLNYKHVKGMNATSFNKHSSTNNLPRDSAGTQSMIGVGAAATGAPTGSQYAKPRMRIQNSMTSQYGGGGGGQSSKRSSHNISQQKNYVGASHERSTYQSSRYQERRSIPNKPGASQQLTDIPIYQLLKAFKLQQYTLKMTDLGYGYDVYKLALLSAAQRDDFIDQLKVVPGHKAKIAGFFSVIDEIYPRSKVVEQISSVTPQRAVGKGGKKRIASAGRTRYHLGPQKTLLQKYEKLDQHTKQAFNNNFLQTLESVKQSIGQIMQQHVNLEESNFAMSQIFPPEQFLGNATRILQEANALQNKGFNAEMEQLVNKFTTGASSAKHLSKQSEQYINRMRSNDRLNNRSTSKDRRLKDIDRINMEVEKKLKAQRKQEKERIKKYGQIYGPNLFQNQKNQPISTNQTAVKNRSRSRERRIKSSSQSTRQLKQVTTGRKPNFQLSRQHTVQKSIDTNKQSSQNYGFSQGNQINKRSMDQQLEQYLKSQEKQMQLQFQPEESVGDGTHEQLSININTNNHLMQSAEQQFLESHSKFQDSEDRPSIQRSNQQDTPYQLPVDSVGPDELPQPNDQSLNHQMSRQDIEKNLSETPSMFDQQNPVDIGESQQHQDLLRGQLEQLQTQIQDIQNRQQQKHLQVSDTKKDLDSTPYKKNFEDTTGGTSGLDAEADIDASDQKKPYTATSEAQNQKVDEDDYDNYDDEQREMAADYGVEMEGREIDGVLLDRQEVTQYGQIEKGRAGHEQEDEIGNNTQEEYAQQFEDLEMSIDVNECQQQYKDVLERQSRCKEEEEEGQEEQQYQDISIATPDISNALRQESEMTTGPGAQLTTGNKYSAYDRQKGEELNLSQLKSVETTEMKFKERKLSPLLEAGEKEAAINLGQSLDSKKVTSALGYLDLKQICYCLARALDRHIQFSQGCFFLEELKVMKQMNKNNQQSPNQDDKLEFSYNLGDKLKIDIEQAKKNQRDRQKKVEKSQQEFEQLKKQMETSQTSPLVKVTPKQLTNSKFRPDIENDDDEEYNDGDLQNINEEQQIEDETQKEKYGTNTHDDDSAADQQYIEDFYDNDGFDNKKEKRGGDRGEEEEGEDNLDMDYSQTQLDDFLKSHSNRGLTSQQLLQSFVSTYNKTKNQRSLPNNLTSAHSGSARALLHGSNQKLNSATSHQHAHSDTKNHQSSSIQPIVEKMLDEEEQEESGRLREAKGADEFDDDIERSPEIVDLNDVRANDDDDANNTTNNSDGLKFNMQKVTDRSYEIASEQSKIGTISKQDKEHTTPKLRQQLNLDDFDVSSKNGFQQLLRFHMRIFDTNYDFESDELVGGEAPYQGNPTLEELYYFCKYVIISGRMEKEIPILCLVYIERFLTKSNLLMNYSNWKRLTLISLILASKIWDDDSLENIHFPQVMTDITLKEITGLEKVFLQLIDFDLVIRGSEYAKYYFILKAFAEQFNSTLPMGPLTVPQMSHLQNNTVKAESELREKYNRKMNLQKSC